MVDVQPVNLCPPDCAHTPNQGIPFVLAPVFADGVFTTQASRRYHRAGQGSPASLVATGDIFITFGQIFRLAFKIRKLHLFLPILYLYATGYFFDDYFLLFSPAE